MPLVSARSQRQTYDNSHLLTRDDRRSCACRKSPASLKQDETQQDKRKTAVRWVGQSQPISYLTRPDRGIIICWHKPTIVAFPCKSISNQQSDLNEHEAMIRSTCCKSSSIRTACPYSIDRTNCAGNLHQTKQAKLTTGVQRDASWTCHWHSVVQAAGVLSQTLQSQKPRITSGCSCGSCETRKTTFDHHNLCKSDKNRTIAKSEKQIRFRFPWQTQVLLTFGHSSFDRLISGNYRTRRHRTTTRATKQGSKDRRK